AQADDVAQPLLLGRLVDGLIVLEACQREASRPDATGQSQGEQGCPADEMRRSASEDEPADPAQTHPITADAQHDLSSLNCLRAPKARRPPHRRRRWLSGTTPSDTPDRH